MWLKIRHFVGTFTGMVEAQTCLDNGCKEYHGTSPSQAGWFHLDEKIKGRGLKYVHFISR